MPNEDKIPTPDEVLGSSKVPTPDEVLGGDLKKKSLPTPAIATSGSDNFSLISGQKSLKEVKESVPYDIYSNPLPTEHPDKPDDIKQAYADKQRIDDTFKNYVMGGGTPPDKDLPKEQKDKMYNWAVQGQTRHMFLTQDKYQDKTVRDQYYNSIDVPKKEKDELIKQGDEAARLKGQYDIARTIAHDKPTPENLFTLGQYQSQIGDKTMAQKTFQTIFNNYPKNPQAYMGFADISVKNGKYGDALKVINEGEQANPDNAYLQAYKAQLLYMHGNHNESIDYANKAVDNSKLDPLQQVYALQTRAHLRDGLNNHAGANEDRAQAMDLEEKLGEGAKFQEQMQPQQDKLKEENKEGFVQKAEKFTQKLENIGLGTQGLVVAKPVNPDQISGFAGLIQHPITTMLKQAIGVYHTVEDLSSKIFEGETIPLDEKGNPVIKPKTISEHTIDLLNTVKDIANLAIYSTPASAAIGTGFNIGMESAEKTLRGTKGEDILRAVSTPVTELGKKAGWESPLAKAFEGMGDMLWQLGLIKGGVKGMKAGGALLNDLGTSIKEAKPSPIGREPIYKDMADVALLEDKIKNGEELTEPEMEKGKTIANNLKQELTDNPEFAQQVGKKLTEKIPTTPVKDIQTDEPTFQWRNKDWKETDKDVINKYSEDYKKGNYVEPVTVLKEGDKYTVVKGHHRLEAAKQAGIEDIPTEEFPGSKSDAQKYAMSFKPAGYIKEGGEPVGIKTIPSGTKNNPVEYKGGKYYKEGENVVDESGKIVSSGQKKKAIISQINKQIDYESIIDLTKFHQDYEKHITILNPEEIETLYGQYEGVSNEPSIGEKEGNNVPPQLEEQDKGKGIEVEQPSTENRQAQATNYKLKDITLTKLKNAVNSSNPYKNVFDVLANNRILNKKQAGELLIGGELSPKGREYVDNFLNGQIAVGGNNQLFEDVKALPEAVNSKIRQSIFAIHELKDFSYLPELQKAIAVYKEFSDAKGINKDLTAGDYIRGKNYPLNEHEQQFLNILHAVNEGAPDNIFNIITNNIRHYYTAMPDMTKTEALNRFFGSDEQVPEHEEINNQLNKETYGQAHGTIAKAEDGGTPNPPDKNPPSGMGGQGEGQAPFDPKGKADEIYDKHLGIWNKTAKWFTEDAPPFTKDRIQNIMTGTYATAESGRQGVSFKHTDYLESWKSTMTGSMAALKTSLTGLANEFYKQYPDIKKSELKVYDFINNKGNSTTIPPDFTPLEGMYVHLIDNVRDGIKNYAKNIKDWNDNTHAFNDSQLQVMLGDMDTYMTRINSKYPGTLLADAESAMREKLVNQSQGKWYSNDFMAKTHSYLEKLGLKRGEVAVKDPDENFHKKSFVKAVAEDGTQKIVHIHENGTISHFIPKEEEQKFQPTILGERPKGGFDEPDWVSVPDANIGSSFEAGGKKWTLQDASVKEIESGSNESYFKNPLMSVLTTFTKMFQVANEVRMYNSLKNEPLFKNQFITLDENQLKFEKEAHNTGNKTPEEYRDAGLPEKAFPLMNVKEPLVQDHNYVKLNGLSDLWENTRWKYAGSKYYENVLAGNPMTSDNFGKTFLNMVYMPMLFGLGHAWNVGTDLAINMFNTGLKSNILDPPDIVSKAYNAYTKRNELYKVIQSAGHKIINEDNGYDEMLKTHILPQMMAQSAPYVNELNNLGGDLFRTKPTMTVSDIAKKFGDGIYWLEKKMAWSPQNVSNIIQLLTKMKQKGLDLDNMDYSKSETMQTIKEAVEENNKRIVDYKVQKYVPNILPGKAGFAVGKFIGTVLGNKNISMFGGYDLGRIRVLTNEIKAMAKIRPDMPEAERIQASEAAQRTLMRIIMLKAHTQVQNIMQRPDDDEYRGLRYTGTLKPAYETYTALKDIANGKSPESAALDWIRNDFNLSPMVTFGEMLLTGKNFMGQHIYDEYNSTPVNTFIKFRNALIGNDNIIKIIDGAWQRNPEMIDKGFAGILEPLNYKKDSPAEAKMAEQLSNFDATKADIKKAKELCQTEATKELEETGRVNNLAPIFQGWYKKMYGYEGELLTGMKRSTGELLDELYGGGTSPKQEKHFSPDIFTPDMIKGYQEQSGQKLDVNMVVNPQISQLHKGDVYKKMENGNYKYYRKGNEGKYTSTEADVPTTPSLIDEENAPDYNIPNPTKEQKAKVREWYYENKMKWLNDRIKERESGKAVGNNNLTEKEYGEMDNWLRSHLQNLKTADLKTEQFRQEYAEFLMTDEANWIKELEEYGKSFTQTKEITK